MDMIPLTDLSNYMVQHRMDLQLVFNIVMSIVMSIIGGLSTIVYNNMRRDVDEAKSLGSKVHALEVLVAGQYITRPTFDKSVELLTDLIKSSREDSRKQSELMLAEVKSLVHEYRKDHHSDLHEINRKIDKIEEESDGAPCRSRRN